SLLSAAQLQSLTRTVRVSFRVQVGAELTIECSPEHASPQKAAEWAAAGVNRVSLGVQSMMRAELRAVGRRHDAQTVGDAFGALCGAGIRDVSVDLIAGLPFQTSQSWEDTLERICELRPTHVSVYMLEVDEDSRLGAELLRGGDRYSAAAVPVEEQVVEFY